MCRSAPSSAVGCCPRCQAKLFSPQVTSQLITLGSYSGDLERAVRAYKFYHVTRLAQLFAAALAAEIKRAQWQADIICAVPLHPLRYLERGYNQSAVLAKLLATTLNTPYRQVLRRTRRTRQQAKLSRAERFANVKDSFKSQPVKGQRIILVDDVITSGATTEACRQALETAGAREVKAVAIAQAYR